MPDSQPELASPPGWRHSLKTRVAVWIGAGAAIAAALGGVALYKVAERRSLAGSEAALQLAVQRTGAELRGLIGSVEVSAATLARAEAAIAGDEARARALLDATVLSGPAIAGGLLALEPRASPRQDLPWAFYAGRQGRGLRHSDLLGLGVEVTAQPWYRDTVAATTPHWSAPYFNDTAGGRWMVTLNQPLPRDGDAVRGMASLDVPIDAFNRALAPFRDDPRLQAILFKGPSWVGDSRWVSIGTPPPNDGSLARLVSPLDASVDGRLVDLADGRRGTAVGVGGDWRLVVLLDDAVVLAPLREVTWRFVGGTVVAILLLALLSNALARRLTQPLVGLGSSAQTLARDGFAMPGALLARRDEIGQLARALDAADTALREQMAQTQRLALEQQKLDSELHLAHDLQRSMLPPSTAVDVAEGRLDIHAHLKPAKSVGGDFYAFHPRDDGMVWFAIGDISDKGVPAALFMARTVAVLEATARSTDSPAMMLARAAPRLAEGNENCMFATALCGLVDPHTGLFELASSGHELPLLVRADGRVEVFAMETSTPLGIDPDAYGEGHAGMLAPGDCLFCFTDGVTDARDRHGELFGEARLHSVLSVPGRTAQQRVADVAAAVETFAEGAEPADDITILAVGLVAPWQPEDAPMHFSIWPAGLRAMNRAIDECLATQGIDAEGQSDVRLVLEELLANALDHGGAGDCSVDLSFTERTITLRIIDDGVAFNPLDTPDLELDENDLDRPIGGLGIHLIKTMALDAIYAREDDRNRLTLVLPRNPP